MSSDEIMRASPALSSGSGHSVVARLIGRPVLWLPPLWLAALWQSYVKIGEVSLEVGASPLSDGTRRIFDLWCRKIGTHECPVPGRTRLIHP